MPPTVQWMVVAVLFLVAPAPLQALLPSSSPTPPNLQCPCIGNIQQGCMQYDSRYQAMTLDEAILTFPDLTQDHSASQPSTIEAEAACTTQECLDCQRDMRRKLYEVGLMPAAIDQAMLTQGNYTTCQKYRFSSEESDDDDDDSSESSEDGNEIKEEKRRKRQVAPSTTGAGAADPTMIGTRYTISCSKKGVVADSQGLISLCSSCWVWRKLPDNYIPQYINELICDNSDGTCLSGYASCQVGQRTLEVSRNEMGRETRIAMTAGTYCECKMNSGSALTSLVQGTGVNGPLPPSTNSGTTLP